MTIVRLFDVRGDGSCFFRAIYQSAILTGNLTAISTSLHLPSPALKEDQFVLETRKRLAKAVLDQQTPHVKYYHHIRTVEANDQAMINKNLPAWLVQAAMNLPTPEAFCAHAARALLSMTTWVSELDIEWMKSHCTLRILSIDHKMQWKQKPEQLLRKQKEELLLINVGSYHYMFIY